MTFVMDWKTGVAARGDAETGPALELVFAGDFAPSERQLNALREGPQAFFGDLLPLFERADRVFCNLECVFSDESFRLVKDGPHLVRPAAFRPAVNALPVNVWCLANNHSMDAGAAGLRETMEWARESGRQTCGAGLRAEDRQPLILEKKGIRVAVINAAEGEEACVNEEGIGVLPMDLATIPGMVRQAKGRADAVIVVAHAGREYVPAPPPYVRALYHALAEAGADLVVGHHPHVTQGVEAWGGGLIYYSLGNFVMDMGAEAGHEREGGLLRVTIAKTGVLRAEWRPLHIGRSGVRLCDGDEKRQRLASFEQQSAHGADAARARMLWDAYTDRWLWRRASAELAAGAALLVEEKDLAGALLRLMQERPPARGWPSVGRRILAFLASRIWPSGGTPAARTFAPSARRGAVRMRNRFRTPAHRELYTHALDRLAEDRVGSADEWAYAYLQRWFEQGLE